MQIGIIGAGRIGSTYAFYLARAGHRVTVIARGARLAALQRDAAIVTVGGATAAVDVADSLDISTPFDLLLVTVLAHQVDAIVPTLAASEARTIIFLFNTFEPVERLRDAVGATRFAMGFPNMSAFFVDGKLKFVVDGPGMVTTLSSSQLAVLLKQAGMPTEIEPDMTSFLRSHVAFVVPLMAAAQLTWQRPQSVSWTEAVRLAAAWKQGFEVVRSLGHKLRPGFVAALASLPRLVSAALLWLLSRSAAVKRLGEFGPDETRQLIDAMVAAAPASTTKLLAIRP